MERTERAAGRARRRAAAGARPHREAIVVACALAATALGLPGCAMLGQHAKPAATAATPAPPVDPAARPGAPPDYDVLVGELAAQEGRFLDAKDAYLRAAQKDPGSAELQRKLARIALKLDDVDGAVGYATEAFRLDPKDEDTRIFLARIHRIRMDLPAVESVLLDANGEPVSDQAVLLLYQVYLERGRLDDALRITRKLVQQEPDLIDGYMALATVYEHMGKRDDAVQVMRDALKRFPDRPILYSRLARMLRAMNDRKAEIALYREMLKKDPDHFGTLVSLGEAQIAINDLKGALETYAKIVRLHPDDLQAVRRYASLEFAAGRYEQAAARLESAFARHPEHYELAYSLAQVVRSMGQDDRAIELFKMVPEYHPAYLEARLQLASIYEDREDYAAALVEVQRLRTLRPSRDLDFHTAELLTRAGHFDQAVAMLEKIRAANPDDDEVLYQLGVCYGTAKRVDEALHYMQLTLEKNPDNPEALNYIGYTWAERGENLDEAERMIQHALDQRPDDGYITDSLGWVHYMRGLPLLNTPDAKTGRSYLKKAREELFHAAELTGGDPVISEHLGDVHMALDDHRRAFEFYQEAVRLEHREDEQPELLEKLERLRKELGEK